MDTHNFNQYQQYQDPIEVQNVESVSTARTFLSRVFGWMFLGLAITGLLAYYFAATPSLTGTLYNPLSGGMSMLGYVVMFAPFALVLLMSFGINRLSYPAMVLTFLVFSALMGMSLSFIFLAYAAASIYMVFFITAGLFGTMALLGYTTHTDLTRFGSLMIMLLIGVIIASVVNFFMHSSTFDYVISFICVAVFTGLTAYDVQKLKNIGGQVNVQSGDASAGKLSILGALTLYLDFINLFLALLRIFGGRKN
jgi:FtsH-binding integral membrane protein